MSGFKESLWNWSYPQLFSLIMTVLIIFIICIIVFVKIRKSKPDKAPSGVVQVAEGYVGYIDSTFDEISTGKIPGAKFYIFTLATFLLIGNLLPILGLEPVVTAYSVPLTLALSTWFGIFIAGAIHRKLKYLWAYIKAPWDLISKVPPLISLSFRIYGNIIGGSLILTMMYTAFAFIFHKIPGVSTSEDYPLKFIIGIIFTPFFHLYFDIFDGLLQTLVFTLLTAVYWSIESTAEEEKPKKVQNSQVGIFKKFGKRKIESIY
ncbi:F-type H+-transporting ATPase subunit a [Mycoplasmopsis mustelae]|uniref:F-type H+-transporting ATPase subunit a n=1 Tax=Mycoplasmopsis mustelae TaxID=171289 RepID=A0A4R7UEN6_9BACT|nr:F0F1 ATP synthase subunit A [Mycoplasmopsis mustelae]TDV24105.1 F-type H+-transporting ATPase subunit a [Mycoplasmopsis mustelae]